MTQGGLRARRSREISGQGRWSLAGDARVVAEGEMLAGALASRPASLGARRRDGFANLLFMPSGRRGGHVLARESQREG